MARTETDELAWLVANPQFSERPATLAEFLGPQYLNIENKVRKRIKQELVAIMGDEVSGENPTLFPEAMITGAIGIGKTTVASVVLPYLAHWLLCLNNPQEYLGLLPGSRIALMQMSTSEQQALEVVFGDIVARIEHSPWFRNFPRDPKFKNQIRFPKDIWIIPGDSAETTFEGYNIFGGILDEADSHKVTERQDYAQLGYDTIKNRITSRFGRRGFLLVIGQMKSGSGFAARMFEQMTKDARSYAVKLTIWESFGMDYYREPDGTLKTFFYDTKRKSIIPSELAREVKLTNSNMMEIPEVYLPEFLNKPEKALKDLAGMPPIVGDPFISLTYKIDDARDRWNARHPHAGSPVDPQGRFSPWFRALDRLKRVVHIDLAYSAEGDALGMAMGHVHEVGEYDGEIKPYIIIDMLLRLHAPAGGEIALSDVRHRLYALRDDLGFKINKVTMDGFQSTDTLQQLQRRRFDTELVSVDKQLLPYHDLREAIYENRIEFPQYMVQLHQGDTDLVEIAVKELTELIDNGKKVDHPPSGSKDIADSMAGVVFTLMGDRKYRRNVVSIDVARRVAAGGVGDMYSSHHAYMGDPGLMAPQSPDALPTWATPRR